MYEVTALRYTFSLYRICIAQILDICDITVPDEILVGLPYLSLELALLFVTLSPMSWPHEKEFFSSQ